MRFPERGVVFCLFTALTLVLLVPLVVMLDVLFVYSVGKALWSRSLIAVAFVLWGILVLFRPVNWGPRYHILLMLFAAWLLAGLVSAWFGVSVQRSLWSSYQRMQGLVDAAHWFVFALMLVAMLRTDAHWRKFLNASLGVGLAVAVFAICRFHFPDSSVFGWWPEPRYPRVAVTLGNPIPLGACMQATMLVALGFLVRSRCGAPASQFSQVFWAVTALCSLWALNLSGSLGALAGGVSGLGAAVLFYAVFGASALSRRFSRRSLAGLGMCGLVLVAAMLLREPAVPTFDTPLIERATSTQRIGSTLGTRLDNWSAGLEAFAEHPLLGWGPENYIVASSHYDESLGATNRARDHAHNVLVEEATTRGIIGFSIWVMLWVCTFRVVLRTARRAAPPQQALLVFAGAALLGWFVQSLSVFYTASSWLQHMVLLGFIVHSGAGAGAPAWLQPAMRCLRWLRVRGVLAAATIAISSASLASSHAIHAGASALKRAEYVGPFMKELGNAIKAFGPLAIFPRTLLFENIAPNWQVILRHNQREAFQLLRWAEAEAVHALADEPENWQLLHGLVKMYTAVAETHPQYADKVQHYRAYALRVAPWQDPLMPGKPPPGLWGQR